MKKLLLLISLTVSIFAAEELGKDIIAEYGEVTYICKNNLVIAKLKMNNIAKEVPVVWEQNNNVAKLECNDFENWLK